ncbi:hypothetical protein Tco_1448195 [Tanacetum coccineum]
MALSIADQIALDDALVAPADRLKIGKCNLRLSSDVTSKEATLQVVYDVLKLTPFYKAFQVTADAPEIYMQEFWASAYVHNRSVRFKMNNKKHIIGLEQFRDILQICPRRVPDALYELQGDISWKSTDDDQDDEQDQDDDDAEKHDVHETTQEEEDDDDHNDDENDQEDDDAHDDDKKADDDDDEELTESDNDGDDFVHPKLTTHDDEIIHEEDTEEDDSSISSSDEEDNDNDVEGANVASAKSDEDATDEKDQGNEAVKDTNTDLDGRDKVMTDVEDTHVTLTPVNPDGQQQSSSVSSGFVSNMLNPNQDTGVDDIFRQHTEATSLIDTSVTAIMEPSFTAQINRPPTPHPIVVQTQQPPIMTPATTTSSLLQNLPNFASLFGFDHRLKALEVNFSELKQTNQYAEALSSIPSTVDQYLAHKMQEAVERAVATNDDRILRRDIVLCKSSQFHETIDDGMKKISHGTCQKNPSAGTDRGPKEEEVGTKPASTSAPSETTKKTTTAGHTTDTDVSEKTCRQEFETCVQDELQIKRTNIFPDWFKNLRDYFLLIMHGIYEGMSYALYKFKEGTYTTTIQDIEIAAFILKGKKKNLKSQPRPTRTDKLRRQDAYTPYSTQEDTSTEKRQKNRLMRIDKTPTSSAMGTLYDWFGLFLMNRLKGIEKWSTYQRPYGSQRDKQSRAMIQAI